jgi:hypothetical protein
VIVAISRPAFEVLRRATFLCVSDLGVNIPAGVSLDPAVKAEIEHLVQAWKVSLTQATTAALAGLLEREGLMDSGARPAVH